MIIVDLRRGGNQPTAPKPGGEAASSECPDVLPHPEWLPRRGDPRACSVCGQMSVLMRCVLFCVWLCAVYGTWKTGGSLIPTSCAPQLGPAGYLILSSQTTPNNSYSTVRKRSNAIVKQFVKVSIKCLEQR